MVKGLAAVRKLVIRAYNNLCKVLGATQNAYYKSDDRRERCVSLWHDVDVQRLIFEAEMNKQPLAAQPLAQLKNLSHLPGLVAVNHI